MTVFLHKTRIFVAVSLMAVLLGTALSACSQIGIPTDGHSSNGYFDQELPQAPSALKVELETYLKARNLLDSVQRDSKGNWYIHQNWVQSPSLRYYLLNFDTRRRHLSEWKVLWYVEPSTTIASGSKLRIAVLELLYLGDPSDSVKAPPETDGNWAESEFDQERARLLFGDFIEWKKSGKLNSPALYFTLKELDAPPKIRTEIKRGYDLNQTPWWVP